MKSFTSLSAFISLALLLLGGTVFAAPVSLVVPQAESVPSVGSTAGATAPVQSSGATVPPAQPSEIDRAAESLAIQAIVSEIEKLAHRDQGSVAAASAKPSDIAIQSTSPSGTKSENVGPSGIEIQSTSPSGTSTKSETIGPSGAEVSVTKQAREESDFNVTTVDPTVGTTAAISAARPALVDRAAPVSAAVSDMAKLFRRGQQPAPSASPTTTQPSVVESQTTSPSGTTTKSETIGPSGEKVSSVSTTKAAREEFDSPIAASIAVPASVANSPSSSAVSPDNSGDDEPDSDDASLENV